MGIEFEISFNRFYLTNWINNWIVIRIMENWINMIAFNGRTKPSPMKFQLMCWREFKMNWMKTIKNISGEWIWLHAWCIVLNNLRLFLLNWCLYSICLAHILACSLQLPAHFSVWTIVLEVPFKVFNAIFSALLFCSWESWESKRRDFNNNFRSYPCSKNYKQTNEQKTIELHQAKEQVTKYTEIARWSE